MREYKVNIRETLEMIACVEAESEMEAVQKVHAMWNDGHYVLDADSFQGVEFTIFEE